MDKITELKAHNDVEKCVYAYKWERCPARAFNTTAEGLDLTVELLYKEFPNAKIIYRLEERRLPEISYWIEVEFDYWANFDLTPIGIK
jgi:hypothetical protein